MYNFPRQVKVGKTDSGTISVVSWLSKETITNLTVSNTDGLVTILDWSFKGGLLSVLYTGVSKGAAEIHFEFTTESRSNCETIICVVVDSC